MIAYIKGRLVTKEPAFVVIDVNGIGYQINISLHTFGTLKDEESCMLHTYLHVKEDAHTLFGFLTESEKATFLDLISISGVGPSTGLMVLSSLSPDEIRQAIANEDVKTIQSIKGIGGKTAQRIILELKDKMRKAGFVEEASDKSPTSNNTLRNEALSALLTLGIGRPAAEKSVDYILKNSGDNITLEELIKRALKTS